MRKPLNLLFFIIVSVCVFLVPLSYAEEPSEDRSALQSETMNLEDMSIDELLILQSKIERILADKGYVRYEELDRGAKGDSVSNVQQRLKELGYYDGTASGKYDSETQKAFKLFEKNNGIVNDGKASQEDLVLLFSSAAVAKSTPTPKPDSTTSKKHTKEKEEDGYLPFSDFDYTEFFRYPEKYYGTKIILKGKAVQVLGSRVSGFQVRLATAGNDDIVYIMIDFDPGFNILENDRLTIYAEMMYPYTYTSTLNVSVTIPSANADRIELN